jgi:hypothetical protein
MMASKIPISEVMVEKKIMFPMIPTGASVHDIRF